MESTWPKSNKVNISTMAKTMPMHRNNFNSDIPEISGHSISLSNIYSLLKCYPLALKTWAYQLIKTLTRVCSQGQDFAEHNQLKIVNPRQAFYFKKDCTLIKVI